MAPVQLKTTRQLKAAHQKETSRPRQYSAAQLQCMERRIAASQKAEDIRDREKRKRKTAKLKKEKESNQLEIDKQQVREGRQPAEYLWGRVRASQPRLHSFFKSNDKTGGLLAKEQLGGLKEDKEKVLEDDETESATEAEADPEFAAGPEEVTATQQEICPVSPSRDPPISSVEIYVSSATLPLSVSGSGDEIFQLFPPPAASARTSSQELPSTGRNESSQPVQPSSWDRTVIRSPFVEARPGATLDRVDDCSDGHSGTIEGSKRKSIELLLPGHSAVKKQKSDPACGPPTMFRSRDEHMKALSIQVTDDEAPAPEFIDGLTLTQIAEVCKDDYLEDGDGLKECPAICRDDPVNQPALSTVAVSQPQIEEPPASPSCLQISFEGSFVHRPRPLLLPPVPPSPAKTIELGPHDGLTSSQILAVCYSSEADCDGDFGVDEKSRSLLQNLTESQENLNCLDLDDCHSLTQPLNQILRTGEAGSSSHSPSNIHCQPSPVKTDCEGWHSDLESDVEVNGHMGMLARAAENSLPWQETSLSRSPRSSQYIDMDGITEDDFLMALKEIENVT